MIALADIGNTTCNILLAEGFHSDPVFFGKVMTGGNDDFVSDLTKILGELKAREEKNGRNITLSVLSSVVTELTNTASSILKTVFAVKTVVISPWMNVNFGLAEETRNGIGADRLADVAYAAANTSLPAVTIDFGTATTFNVLTKDCFFKGGAIAAGAWTCLKALYEKTSKLPRLVPEPPKTAIGVDTKGCMMTGAVIGQAGLVDGILRSFEEELGEPVSVLLTGGYADIIIPFIRHPYVKVDNMVAKGMLILAEKEQ